MSLMIQKIIQHGDSITIKIESCDCNKDKKCEDNCTEMMELKDKHTGEIKQLQEDVSVLDKIIENVKKATEGDE